MGVAARAVVVAVRLGRRVDVGRQPGHLAEQATEQLAPELFEILRCQADAGGAGTPDPIAPSQGFPCKLDSFIEAWRLTGDPIFAQAMYGPDGSLAAGITAATSYMVSHLERSASVRAYCLNDSGHLMAPTSGIAGEDAREEPLLQGAQGNSLLPHEHLATLGRRHVDLPHFDSFFSRDYCGF